MYRSRKAEKKNRKKKKKKLLSRLCFFLGVVSVLLSLRERKQAEKKRKIPCCIASICVSSLVCFVLDPMCVLFP